MREARIHEFTTADIARQRFYRRIVRGKRYAPPVLDRIRACKTAEEVHVLMSSLLAEHPSSGTRRQWRQAAEDRLGQLRG